MRALPFVLALSLAACASDPPTHDAEPVTMTIDALAWRRTHAEARLYLDAHLVECESGAQLKAFTAAADRDFELIVEGAAPVLLSCGVGGRTMTVGDGVSCSLMLRPHDGDWRPAEGRSYRLVPKNRDSELRWIVVEGLTAPPLDID
ncbi:MAG: hypothetical protein H6831_16205 [Planctomycetes bacterium]|nr:hypothetical protein [Planctomycetota bacterium]MCB9905943.1 hypothetical protein [Planctomycetota bacterium]